MNKLCFSANSSFPNEKKFIKKEMLCESAVSKTKQDKEILQKNDAHLDQSLQRANTRNLFQEIGKFTEAKK